jgi:hypothetical protein
MEVIGGRKFVELPGDRTHELPPLLVRTKPEASRLERVMAMASTVAEDEEMIPNLSVEFRGQDTLLERHKMDLAIQLVEQYVGLLDQWYWGDSILDWIRQCEVTFGNRLDLKPLLRPDLWPHAGRSSFVVLLRDKAVDTKGIELERAVGMRLAFRQPPPLSCFSNQFLFFLKSSVAATAYQTWARMSPDPVSSLPPERFHFDVLSMAV